MSQNPFDQQQSQQEQNPFGQQPTSNPFGQQQSGFGSGPSGFQQPMQPKKSGGGSRCLLIGIGVVVLICLICCGLSVAGALAFKGPLMAGVWSSSVGSGDYSTSVCPGSQAEEFSLDYEGEVNSFTLTTVEDSNGVITLTGNAVTRFNGTREDTLLMTMSSDDDALFPTSGCIATIKKQ